MTKSRRSSLITPNLLGLTIAKRRAFKSLIRRRRRICQHRKYRSGSRLFPQPLRRRIIDTRGCQVHGRGHGVCHSLRCGRHSGLVAYGRVPAPYFTTKKSTKKYKKTRKIFQSSTFFFRKLRFIYFSCSFVSYTLKQMVCAHFYHWVFTNNIN